MIQNDGNYFYFCDNHYNEFGQPGDIVVNLRAKKELSPQIPDFCPNCDALNSFRRLIRETEQIYRNEKIVVMASCWSCQSCKFELLGDGDLDELSTQVKKEYERKYKEN